MLLFALLLPLVLAQRSTFPMSTEMNQVVTDGSCGLQREMCVRMEHKCSREWIMCNFGGRCTPVEFHPQTIHARRCKEFVRTTCSESMHAELEEACVFHTMGITVIGVDEIVCSQQVQQTGEEMKRRMTGQDYDQFICSQERVRSLYGNGCRAQMPIHQLRNLHACKREFHNVCPSERRESVMRFCEIETGIVPYEWLSQPNVWPTWLTQQHQQQTPYHHQSQFRSYSPFSTPYGQQYQHQTQFGRDQSSMNPNWMPFWMTGSSMMNRGMGGVDPMCERWVRKMCVNQQYGGGVGQQSMYGHGVYGQGGQSMYGQGGQSMYGQGGQSMYGQGVYGQGGQGQTYGTGMYGQGQVYGPMNVGQTYGTGVYGHHGYGQGGQGQTYGTGMYGQGQVYGTGVHGYGQGGQGQSYGHGYGIFGRGIGGVGGYGQTYGMHHQQTQTPQYDVENTVTGN
jgi:hypothetical protein